MTVWFSAASYASRLLLVTSSPARPTFTPTRYEYLPLPLSLQLFLNIPKDAHSLQPKPGSHSHKGGPHGSHTPISSGVRNTANTNDLDVTQLRFPLIQHP